MRLFKENASQKIELFRFIFISAQELGKFWNFRAEPGKKFEVKGTED